MTKREFLKMVIVGVVGAALFIALFIGAVLQESYKLCPLTEAEIAEIGG